MSRSQRGYTLLEIIISMAIFSVIIVIFSLLAAEMRSHQKRYPVNFSKHPQISAVLSRMRRDVQDAYGPSPYVNSFSGYTMGPKTLIIQSIQQNRGLATIVWDFSEPGVVLRRSFNVGVATDWVARGVPKEFNVEIDAIKFSQRPYGVRIQATDEEGRVAIDQILQPRAHQ